MRRSGWLLFVFVALSPLWVLAQGSGYNSSLSGTSIATGAQPSIFSNNKMLYHQLAWTVSGTVATCTIALDTSPDGVTWTAGGLITGQSCTSNGNSAVTSGQAAFLRPNVTALSGAGATLKWTYTGWAYNPSGGGGGTPPGGANLQLQLNNSGTFGGAHADDGGTTLGTLTASEPLQITASGNGTSFTEAALCTAVPSLDILCSVTGVGMELSNNNGTFSPIITGANRPPDPSIVGGIIGIGSTTGTTSSVTTGVFTNVAPGATNYFSVSTDDLWIASETHYITSANTSAMWRHSVICCSGANGLDMFPFFSTPFQAAANSVTAFPNVPAFFIGSGIHFGFHTSAFGTTPGTYQALSAQFIGSTKGLLGTNQINTQLAGSGTTYTGPSQKNGLNANGTEGLVEVPMPFALTATGVCFYVLGGAQPAGGALTITVDNNAVASSIVATAAASGGTNEQFCDLAHTASFAAGDRMSFKEVNASGSTGATVTGIDAGYTPLNAGPTALLIWGMGTLSVANTDQYWMALTGTPSTATIANAGFPMPRGGTMKNLYCYVTAAPATTNEVITVMLNGVATALTITLSTGQAVPNNVTDLTHSFIFNRGDLLALKTTQSGTGTGPSISGCSAEID